MKLTSSVKYHTNSVKSLKLNKSKSNRKGILNTITSSFLNKTLDTKEKTQNNKKQNLVNLNSEGIIQKINHNNQNTQSCSYIIKTHNLGSKTSRDDTHKKQKDLYKNSNDKTNLAVFQDYLQNGIIIKNNQHKRNRSQQVQHLICPQNKKSLLSLKPKLQKNKQMIQQKNTGVIQTIGQIMVNKMKKIKNFMKNKKNNQQYSPQQNNLKSFDYNKQNLHNNTILSANKSNCQVKYQFQSGLIQNKSIIHSILNISFQNQIDDINNHDNKPRTKNYLELSDFLIGKKVGKGRFGNVFQIQHIQTQSIYALKVLSKNQIKEQQMQQQILLQIKLQMYLDHPNILKLYSFFDDFQNIYLILEYAAENCLFRKLRKQISFSEQKVSQYSRQLIGSMKHFHAQSILHRDIKPENIMLSFDLIKLADFGWSVYSPVYKRQTFCGTVDYVSPEIIKGQYYDQKVDIWSLGILLYELAIGRAPFQANNNLQNQTFQRILSNNLNFPKTISPQLKELIGQILTDPDKRISLQEIQSSKWIKNHEFNGRFIDPQIYDFWKRLDQNNKFSLL